MLADFGQRESVGTIENKRKASNLNRLLVLFFMAGDEGFEH